MPKVVKAPQEIMAGVSEEKSKDSPAAPTGKTWVFIKNFSPHKPFKFEDGTEFTFPNHPFVTTDQKLAEKILKVADRFKIVQR